MDVKELKQYIYDNNYVEIILESIHCHHIKYHPTNEYWSCANYDGDNNSAIVIYNNESLNCINYTRQMTSNGYSTDLITLVEYSKSISFFNALQFICETIGISYYYDFQGDMPKSFQILDLLAEMQTDFDTEEDIPLQPISEKILSYYYPYVNDLFYEDHIDYTTQRIFEIGFDPETNRYTIPIRSEIGDLVGVKGRYFYRDVPEDQNKYMYLEPCSKSKILYGLDKTYDSIKENNCVYIVEAEKGVMQLWSYGVHNSISTGGKMLSQYQITLLIRLNVTLILCLDKDVLKDELNIIADKFPDNVPLYAVYDTDNLLTGHESPTDNPSIWQKLHDNYIYKIK